MKYFMDGGKGVPGEVDANLGEDEDQDDFEDDEEDDDFGDEEDEEDEDVDGGPVE
jgi:hypothetical protein